MADSSPHDFAPGSAAGDTPAASGAAGGRSAGGTGTWHLTIGTARGSTHQAIGLPNQDSVAHRAAGPGGPVVVAVADGHGHTRHFRSAEGSALAVAVGCRAGARLAAGLGGARRAEVAEAARSDLGPAVVSDWRSAVAGHIAAHPYTAQEQATLDANGDSPQIPYGSTLLLAVAGPHWLACAQIGDGDVLAVRADGRAFFPLPPDDRLDGRHTTSLCQPDALDSFRVSVHDLDEKPLLAVLLATDGYSNAQADDPWQVGVGRDLAEMAAEHDDAWFAEQVPDWARRCASADGSGDDTTIALLLNTGALTQGAGADWRAPDGPAAIADEMRTTATLVLPPGYPAAGPTASTAAPTLPPGPAARGRGRRLRLWAVALLVAAAVVAGVVAALAHRPAQQPARPRVTPGSGIHKAGAAGHGPDVGSRSRGG